MTERRRASRGDGHDDDTRKMRVTRGGSGLRPAAEPAVETMPPESGAKKKFDEPSGMRAALDPALANKAGPTLPVADSVGLGDVPVMLDVPANMNEEDTELHRLLCAVDGVSSIVEIAARAGVEAELARARFAELSNEGHVTFERHAQAESDVESIRKAQLEVRTPEFWLEGLKPRSRR